MKCLAQYRVTNTLIEMIFRWVVHAICWIAQVLCIRGRSTIQYTAPLRLHVRQLTPYNYSKRILLLLANEMKIFLCPGYKKRLSQQHVVKRIPLGDTVIKQKIW
jgi:hypothetical protein